MAAKHSNKEEDRTLTRVVQLLSWQTIQYINIMRGVVVFVATAWILVHDMHPTLGFCPVLLHPPTRHAAQRRQVAASSSASLSSIPTTITNNSNASPLSLDMEELADVLQGRGRAKIVWQHLRLGLDPYDGSCLAANDDKPTDKEKLPPSLGHKARQIYQDAFGTTTSPRLTETIASLVQTTRAADGTTKLLFRCVADHLEVETVIIPWDDRQQSTLCVSSQVGCKQGCTFCLTGKMGKLRSLTSDEILCQVAVANAVCRLQNIYPIDNIVFMGE